MKFRIFPVLTCSIAFALACAGGGSTEAPAPPAPPPPAPPVEAPPSAGGDAIGVQECDDYIKRMTDCLGTMDPVSKSAMESSFTMMRDSWKQAAATPEGKAGLQAGCKAALDSIPPTCAAGAGGAPPAGGDPAAAGGAAPAGTAAPAAPAPDAAKPTGPSDHHQGPPNMPPPGGKRNDGGGGGGNMPPPKHN